MTSLALTALLGEFQEALANLTRVEERMEGKTGATHMCKLRSQKR
jgi:hypothetical protein